MKRWHRVWHETPSTRRHSATLYQNISQTQFVDECRYLEKIIAVVGVSHDHVSTRRSRDSTHESGTVTTFFDRHESGTIRYCDGLGSISASIIGNDDLPGNLALVERLPRFPDATCHGIGLVQAWNNHGHLWCVCA